MMYNGYITKTKRVLSIVLALLLLFTMIPGSLQEGFAYAAEIVDSGEYENISWTLDSDGLLTITGEGDMPEFTDKIPWSKYWAELLAVSLDERLTSISARAFCGGTYIKSINIPDGVTSIGNDAFENCPGMKEIYISDIVKYLSINYGNRFSHPSVFGTAELYINGEPAENIVIPEGMTAICDTAFYGCKHLKSVIIPDSVTSIGNQAFSNCYTLTSIEIPGDVTYIGESAFSGCTGITNITIPDNVTIITWSTFSGCTGITNITIPANVTSIYMGAFERCSNLTSIAIPDSVTYIKNSAFYDSSNIKNIIYYGDELNWDGINIEDNNEPLSSATRYDLLVTDPEYTGDPVRPEISVMQGETALVQGTDYTVSFDAETTEVDEAGEAVVSFIGAYSDLGTLECKYSVIPKSIDIVASGTCGINGDNLTWTLDEEGLLTISGEGCMTVWGNYREVPWSNLIASIKKVIIEDGVTDIGHCAFHNGVNIEEIVIADSVNSLGVGAFRNCSSLKSVTIPTGVTSISNTAFAYCSGLTSVVLPKSITGIETAAFENCSSLRSIDIPDSVVNIGAAAFSGCTNLTDVTIPDGITSLEMEVFCDCKSLSTITIPDSITGLGSGAFSGCESLTDICLPQGVLNIDDMVFYGCSSLLSIMIPDSVNSIIGDHIVEGCNNLTSIYVIKDSYADTWLKDNSYSEKIKYVYKSGEHYYYETVTEPTCEETGTKHLLCVVCNEETNEQIPALGHNITKVEAKEATEFEEGNIEYWLCSVCGKYFADENGTQEISADSIVIPKLDPTYAELSWNIDDDGVLTVSGEGRMPDFDKASDAPWYSERTNIKKIIVSEGLTTIGSRAFYQCTNVTEVEIASTVKTIGAWAFYNNTSLAEVTIPAGVISMGDSAFRTCSSLTRMQFEGNAPALGNYVFTDTASDLAIHHYENAEGWDAEAWGNYNVVADHKFGEFTVISEPSCTEHGTKQGVCEICGETITEEIPALGHDYVDGYCTRCGEREVLSSGKCGENVNYILYGDGELIISGSGSMYNWPRNTSVPWYGYSERIETITIENGITSIGDGAFWGCSLLMDITIPNSVTSIGHSAFRSCSNLVKITIPENISCIGRLAFCECSNLTNINIPEGISSIEYQSFYKCNSLTNVTIPEGVTQIGEYAFSNCSSLTNVTIPESVTQIGENAFSNCSSIASIQLPEGISCIDYMTFYGCFSLQSFTIPESVTSIGSLAFGSCTSLKDIKLPESITGIGNGAFEGCSNLISILIPVDITNIGESILKGCNSLKQVYVIKDSYPDTWLKDNGYSEKTKYVFKSGEHYYYETVTDPTCEGNGAKYIVCVICGDTKEEYIPALGHSITKVEAKEATLREDGNIEYWLCERCGKCFSDAEGTNELSAESVVIPKTGGEIVDSGTCGANGDNLAWSLDEDGVLVISGTGEMYDYTTSGSYSAPWDKKLIKQVIVEKGVSKLGRYAFDSCVNLENVMISDGVVSLGYCGFMGCTSLTSVSLPESLTSIDYGAFWDCSNLERIEIPESVTQIEYGAFNGCYNLKNVTIPESVTSIGGHAFEYCKKLSMITIPDSVTLIDSYAFAACDDLEKVVISNNVTSIGDFAFSSCTGLKDVVIPKSVTSIGLSTFYNCYSLNSVMIPESVTDIGASVFSVCPNLSNVYVIKDSYADTWIKDNGYSEKIKYVYESGDHYFYDTLVEATCTSSGSRSSLCVVCGEEITENILALGHDWSEPTYVWNTDHSCMTATFVCRNDSSHKDTVIAEGSAITSEITKEPTTAAPGEKVYTASITFDGKTYTATDTVVIPKLQQVIRIFGSTRYETSLNVARELKERLGGEKFKAVVVTNGGFYPDALSGSYLSCTLKAPVLLMDTSRGRISAVQEFIKENLEPGGMVYLLGGTAVVPDSVMTGLNGFKHQRLGGATRYETNIAIIKETARVSGEEVRELIVCSGNGFADSLSAAATGKPIMILNTTLLDCQKDYLSSLKGNGLKITIVGGSGVISNALANSLSAYGEIDERVWGQTRYETSAKVAGKFFPKTTSGIIALGTNFPDGLCGGVLANTIGGPMVLVANGTTANAEEYAEASGMSSGIVLGGPALVNDATVKAVFHAE